MVHSDDKGLVLPPRSHPSKPSSSPIYKTDSKAAVLAYGDKLFSAIKAAGVRVKFDTDDTQSPGWKFAEWEMRGTPVRIEIGPRDMEGGKCVIVRRDSGEKLIVSADEAPAIVQRLMGEIQKGLFEKAKAFRDANLKTVTNHEEMLAFFGKETAGTTDAPGGFAEGLWCGNPECEAKLKATPR